MEKEKKIMYSDMQGTVPLKPVPEELQNVSGKKKKPKKPQRKEFSYPKYQSASILNSFTGAMMGVALRENGQYFIKISDCDRQIKLHGEVPDQDGKDDYDGINEFLGKTLTLTDELSKFVAHVISEALKNGVTFDKNNLKSLLVKQIIRLEALESIL